MSRAYVEEMKMNGGKALGRSKMRKFLQRPGRVNKDGTPQYTTEQAHQSECDILSIIRRYDTVGVISNVSKIEAKFGDMTGNDFQEMSNRVSAAKSMFEALPSDIRKEFNNSPAALLTFMEDSKNRDKAIELGLIDPDWSPDQDGLGEHVIRENDPSSEDLSPESGVEKPD